MSETRTQKRQTETLNETLQKMFNHFMQQRSTIAYPVKGKIICIDDVVLKNLYKNIDYNWKRFCGIWNKRDGVKANIHAFGEEVSAFCKNECKAAWVNDLKHIVVDIFHCKEYKYADFEKEFKLAESNDNLVKSIYHAERDSEEVAVEMISKIFLKLNEVNPVEVVEDPVTDLKTTLQHIYAKGMLYLLKKLGVKPPKDVQEIKNCIIDPLTPVSLFNAAIDRIKNPEWEFVQICCETRNDNTVESSMYIFSQELAEEVSDTSLDELARPKSERPVDPCFGHEKEWFHE